MWCVHFIQVVSEASAYLKDVIGIDSVPGRWQFLSTIHWQKWAGPKRYGKYMHTLCTRQPVRRQTLTLYDFSLCCKTATLKCLSDPLNNPPSYLTIWHFLSWLPCPVLSSLLFAASLPLTSTTLIWQFILLYIFSILHRSLFRAKSLQETALIVESVFLSPSFFSLSWHHLIRRHRESCSPAAYKEPRFHYV